MNHLLTATLTLGLASLTTGQSVLLFLESSEPLGADGMDTRAIVPGDLDNDGDEDVFIANWGQDNILYKNKGAARFEVAPTQDINTDGGFTFDAAWGDFDGDGDLDLAMANGNLTNNGLYRNIFGQGGAAAGRFEKITTGPVVTDGGETYSVAWGDVNGDGFLDLAFANKLSENFLYTNDSLGNFTRVVTGPISTDIAPSRDVAFADLDNDGDLELMFANSNDLPNDIYINQGMQQGGTEGTFVKLAGDPLATSAKRSRSITAIDFDKDGDKDVFVTNRVGQDNELFLNDGDGNFTVGTGHATEDGGDSYYAAWGDIEGDGDVDLFVANRDEVDFLYLNDGAGGLQRVTVGDVVSNVGSSRHGAFADFDQDGSPELVVANTDGQDNLYYRNHGFMWVDLGGGVAGDTTPLLTAAGDMGPASTVRYFVEGGPSNAPTTLIVGLTSLFAPFKGGTLVPAPDIMVPGLTTNGAGRMELAVTWPVGLPGGTTIYYQCWHVDGSAPTGFSATNGMSGTTP